MGGELKKYLNGSIKDDQRTTEAQENHTQHPTPGSINVQSKSEGTTTNTQHPGPNTQQTTYILSSTSAYVSIQQ